MTVLLGIGVVVIGFLLRLNTLLVVTVAGLVTAQVAGWSLGETVATLGRSFLDSRSVTLPVILMVSVVGLLERHGLQERAEVLIRGTRAATAGRVLWLYSLVRQVSIALGVNLGGHAQAVRPLVAPMAVAAARATEGELSEPTVHRIRAHAAAAENLGNFFGEDIFIAVGAVLLMKNFFDAAGLEVSVWAMALWGIPTAVIATAAMAWRCRVLDRAVRRAAVKPEGTP